MQRIAQFIAVFASIWCFLPHTSAQNQWNVERTLQWPNAPKTFETPERSISIWTFKGSTTTRIFGRLPVWSERFPIASDGTAELSLLNTQFAAIKLENPDFLPEQDVQLSWKVEQEREKYYLRVQILPLRKAGVGFERLERFTLQVSFTGTPTANFSSDRNPPLTYTSALADGSVYKFGITKTNVVKLDYNYLKNDLKIANIDQLDPRTIRIYGNGGARLPERAGDAQTDDLIENAIKIVGESDGKFDQSDFILMYGEGPVVFKHDPTSAGTRITGTVNIYSKESYYFLKTGTGNGLRIPEVASIDAGGVVATEFDDVIRLEEEEVNLLDFYSLAQGSGQDWFGDYFKEARTKNYSDKFKFPNAVVGSTGRIRASFVGRSNTQTTARLTVDDLITTRTIPGVNTAENEGQYGQEAQFTGTFNVTKDQPNVQIDYLQTAGLSEGWIDYIELQVRRKLLYTSGSSLIFRSLESLSQPVTEFQVSGAGATGLMVWDITDGQLPRDQKLNISGSTATFGARTDVTLRNYIAFGTSDAVKPDITVGAIPNQNIHAHDHQDLAIIYHKNFKEQAERLAQHRRIFSGFETVTVDIDQLYNEFSSGKKDPTAIRDYAKMLLERDARFKYLLLFGDGSFDPRTISDAGGGDFMPVFETPESLQPIYAYPSDDYFGLLSDNEGSPLDGALDISVGRLPVTTAEESKAVVDKIIAYDNDPITLGDWHNRTVYLADDEDGNVHLSQTEDLERMTRQRVDFLNSDKIYLDAYQQVATSGGQFYPEAKKAFNANFFKGNLIVHYIGHGGPRGWTQERTIDNNDIALWGNDHRCPLIISATCSFGGYDNPRFLSGGEQSLLKAKNGAIALFTTVRAVYISGNNLLTDAVESVIFTRENNKYRTLGKVLSDAKNTLGGNDDNSRRFTLLGDPAQTLALPEYRVATTTINGKQYDATNPDTISALEQVTLTGEIRDTSGNLVQGFNGRVFVTVFDKPQKLQTLGQDPNSQVVQFEVQRSIIFRGAASVTAGRFSVAFTTPKDINYAPGQGKISYYAENGTPLDAAGSDRGFIVAGISNTINDDQPPFVQVFMNDDKFVTGGVTDSNPRIYAKVSDDYGINITGTSIGHDLTGVVDANVQETIVLNDFYQSNLDNSKAGTVTYPLNNIKPGLHKVSVKAWDIANNKGEGFTEFLVATSADAALDHVLNYPNPFTTSTNFTFEHNLVGQVLDIQVRIFTVSGKLVKTILHQSNASGYRVNDVHWDGKDDFGDDIGKGVYVYKVAVRGTDLTGKKSEIESKFEKLVILK
jgi:Peptidase family C25